VHPSKLEYVEAGLNKFAERYEQMGITSISFLQLGTQGMVLWLGRIPAQLVAQPRPGRGQAYLFFWLDHPDITAGIINLNANAAQPGINQQGVYPTSGVANAYLGLGESLKIRKDLKCYPGITKKAMAQQKLIFG